MNEPAAVSNNGTYFQIIIYYLLYIQRAKEMLQYGKERGECYGMQNMQRAAYIDVDLCFVKTLR